MQKSMHPKHKKHECSMKKFRIWMRFQHDVREKTSCLKKVKPRRPLYSCSRIRVGEGSPKEEGTNKFRSTHTNHSKTCHKRAMQNIWKIHDTSTQNEANMHEKSIPKSITYWNWRSQARKWRLEARKLRLESGKWNLEAEKRRLMDTRIEIWSPVLGWRGAPGAVRTRTPRGQGPNICIDR